MQKHLLTLAVTSITAGLALSGQVMAEQHENANGQGNGQNQQQSNGQNQQQSVQQAQGLYATENIMGSDVYHVDDTDEDVGEVSNILVDDEGKISALVLDTGGLWGIGGDEVVVGIEHFSVETERDENTTFGQGSTMHRIMVDATEEELENFPSYEEDWFDQERSRLIEQRGMRGSAWQGEGVSGGTWGREGAVDEN